MCFSESLLALRHKALEEVKPYYSAVDDIAEKNTARILEIFRKHQIASYHFSATTGYGYNDAGRDKLEEVWADVCGAEKTLVRTQFVSGTHALATVLFGILRPGDELLAVTGAPYDTMQSVIGYAQDSPGSLKDFGVAYREIAMTASGEVDFAALKNAIHAKTKVALIQRSRGYSLRNPLQISQITAICEFIKRIKPDCICFVDNCYGEFVDSLEPTVAGADIMAGSLIKNPGGGLAATGGYIAGRSDLVEMAAYRLTAPGIGSEVGSSIGGNRLLYQGLFMAPHTTAQAVKGAIFAAAFFSLSGYTTFPGLSERRSDIIQAIQLNSPEKMVAFCRGLQKYSPVDSHVKPEPSGMPGYSDAVIMAGGTFVQGSSIELSADGPLRPPYAVYLQGGLTLEHVILGVMGAAAEMENLR